MPHLNIFNVIGPREFSASTKRIHPYAQLMTDIFVEAANEKSGLITVNISPRSLARYTTPDSKRALRLLALTTWRRCRDLGLCINDREGFVQFCREKCGGETNDDLIDVMTEAYQRFVVTTGGE